MGRRTWAATGAPSPSISSRSEEHTSELQSHVNLVCRLLLDTQTTSIYTLSLHDALPIFKQRGEAIAQMNTNELANVHFPYRSPFAGEPVIVEAPGYAPLTVNGPQDLGSDGRTVTLHK